MDEETPVGFGTQHIPPAARTRGIAAAITTISTVGIGISLSGPLFSLVMERQGYSDAVIGLSTATVGVSALVASPTVPRLAKRFGVFWTMMASLLTAIVSIALIYWMNNAIGWFVLRFVLGAALTGIFVISEFWIFALAPEERRGFVMGVYATVLSLGFAVGPAILSATGSVGALPFVIAVGLLAASLIPVGIARASAPRIEPEHNTHFLPFLFAAPLAIGAVFVFGMAESSSFSFLALYGTRLGFDETTAVNLVTVMALGGLFCHIPLGLMADRFDRRLLLLACGSIGAAGALLLPVLAANLVALNVVLLFWGGITAGLYTIGLTHIGARFRGGELAGVNAAFVFTYAVGMLVGPAAVGKSMDIWVPHGFSWSLAFAFALFTLLAIWRWAKPGRRTASA